MYKKPQKGGKNMGKRITVALDAMGGDYAPLETVKGAVDAVKELDVNIKLVGPAEQLHAEDVYKRQIQHRIPQKFQTLVVFMAAFFRFVGIGAVCQGQNQQIFIRKRICNFPFKFFQIQMVHIYSSSFAATSSAI